MYGDTFKSLHCGVSSVSVQKTVTRQLRHCARGHRTGGPQLALELGPAGVRSCGANRAPEGKGGLGLKGQVLLDPSLREPDRPLQLRTFAGPSSKASCGPPRPVSSRVVLQLPGYRPFIPRTRHNGGFPMRHHTSPVYGFYYVFQFNGEQLDCVRIPLVATVMR
ncbi:hypothetical protein NDU88_001776 [Pleurodeles waltl]|uniref:Uncharacterized protein n=1 Tax=Pleurodeles waltl TaxID=8319 RepID=A0AAV7S9X1_PLEWA|nr:hypothetical protein NDU88_001776 [Pleurodeles waltl]